MKRDEEIEKISMKIQKEIDKLKNINCFVSSCYEGICVFDDNIKPKKISYEDDFSESIVFTFNTTRIIKSK